MIAYHSHKYSHKGISSLFKMCTCPTDCELLPPLKEMKNNYLLFISSLNSSLLEARGVVTIGGPMGVGPAGA
jgi:hypothetical protein